MRLIQNVKGLSKLALTLLLLVSFVMGATVSYIWTMGFYSPLEFQLPDLSLSIEKVEFFVEDATYFNVTVLNPSFSSSSARVDQIKVSVDDKIYSVAMVEPALPQELEPGDSVEFKSFWNWGNYTVAQSIEVIVLVHEGSGANLEKQTPFVNFTVVQVNFDPSVSARNFTVTLRSMLSVNVTKFLLEGVEITEVAPSLPHTLDPDVPFNFTLSRDWTDLQDRTVVVDVETLQGYRAHKIEKLPLMVLEIIAPKFDETDRSHFNLSVLNAPTSPAPVDISEVIIRVGSDITILNSTQWTASPSARLEPSIEPTRLVCSWDWSPLNQGDTVTIVVSTLQGFQTPPFETVPLP